MIAPSQAIPLDFGDAGSITGHRAVQIRGKNPTTAQVDAKVNAERGNNHWYANAIVDHESYGNRQFNPDNLGNNYRVDLGPNFTNIHGRWLPYFGYPDGWGVAQRDPWPGLDEVWNWHKNIKGFIGELNEKRVTAEGWIEEQVHQQVEERSDLPLANEVFTFSGIAYQEGTPRTATDACTIQLYNGADPYVISWENLVIGNPDRPGRWVQKTEEEQDYVYNVSDHIN